MLRKLLKYDFRANLKIFLFIWPAILVFALIERLVISADLDGSISGLLVGSVTTMYILAIIAACVFALVISVVRFYSGLLGREGYLMFTLPVKPWQVLLSKFITATVTIFVTTLISIISAFFLLDGIENFFDVAKLVWSSLDLPTGITLTLVGLISLVSFCVQVLQIYMACSLGHLFRKRRVLWSVLAYYVINVLIEVVATTALTVLGMSGLLNGIDTHGGINLLLAGVLIAMAVLGALFFFGSEYILRNRLNLE